MFGYPCLLRYNTLPTYESFAALLSMYLGNIYPKTLRHVPTKTWGSQNTKSQDKRYFVISKKVKWSRYRPGVAQKVGRDIALLFHDRGTRMGWVVSSTQRPHFTPGKDPVPILQEVGWAPGSVWTGAKNLVPTGFNPRTAQPVASCYADWATGPTFCNNWGW